MSQSEVERLRDEVLAAAADSEHLTVDGIVEFHGRHVKPVAKALDALLAPVRREERERCAKEAEALPDPYPTDVFPEVTSEQWAQVREAMTPLGFPLDRVSASNMRFARQAAIREAAAALRAGEGER